MAFAFGATLSIGEWLVRLPESGPWDASASEREYVDFKETPETSGVPAHARKDASKRFRKDLVEHAICFANSRGGSLIIGVRVRAAEGEQVVPGVDIDAWSPDEIKELIYNRTRPHLLVDVAVETVIGAPIIVIRIPQGEEIHGTADGVFKHRQRDACVPLDEPTMRALRAARGRYDWTAQPTPFGLEGVSRAALEEAASRLRARGRDELAIVAEREPEQYLRDVGLLSEGVITRAAILLYSTEVALRSAISHWGILLRTWTCRAIRPSLSSFVHEDDVVRLLHPIGEWPAGTEGTALVVVAGRLSIEPPSGTDGFNFIEAIDVDVEVVWRIGVGRLWPPLRAPKTAG